MWEIRRICANQFHQKTIWNSLSQDTSHHLSGVPALNWAACWWSWLVITLLLLFPHFSDPAMSTITPHVLTPLHHHLAVVLALNWRGPMMERALAFPVASKALQLHLLNLFGRVKTSSQASSRIQYSILKLWHSEELPWRQSILNDSWGRVKIGRNTGTRASHLSPTSSD